MRSRPRHTAAPERFVWTNQQNHSLPLTSSARVYHRLGQNSILSRVKMMLISVVVCEKKQRLEVARGFTVFTSQYYLLHPIPTQPVKQRSKARSLPHRHRPCCWRRRLR